MMTNNWSPVTMSGFGAYGAVPLVGGAIAAAAGPFPVQHPSWLFYSLSRKIAVVKGEITRLKAKKQTSRRKGRIVELQTLLAKLKQKAKAKAARKDTSALDAEIAALSTPFMDDSDVGLGPDAMMAPAVPEASGGSSALPLVMLGLGAAVLIGAVAYKRKRSR